MLLGGRLLRLGAGGGFCRGALLRLLRLGAGSGFRRAALLRLLTCGRFRRRSLLLGSGLGRGTLLRLLPGSGFGRGPLLRLLTENFLLLIALLHELLLRTRSAGGMRGRRSQVRRGCSLAG
jgi:hypothetical protein